MNTDLSIQLPNETAIEYYKRCRLVLEDKVKNLEAELEKLQKEEKRWEDRHKRKIIEQTIHHEIEIKKLEAEVESLKCCGNCHFEAFDGEGCYNTTICENYSCWEKA